MPSPAFLVIRQAILDRDQIVATYHGHRRELCPHVLGYKDGEEQALFLQFGGESGSGLSADPRQNWRCMPVGELTDVVARPGPWHTAPNDRRPQTCVDVVVAQATAPPRRRG